jgi:hypothetical protein
MDSDEAKKYGAGCGVLILLIFGLIGFFSMRDARQAGMELRTQREQERLQAEAEVPASSPAPVVERKSPEAEIESLWHREEHREAYALAQALLRGGNDEEQAAARKWLPGLLGSLFEQAVQGQDLAAAKAIRAETRGLPGATNSTAAPEARKFAERLKDELVNMGRRLQELQVEQVRQLLAAGDDAKIDLAIEAAWQDPEAALPEQEVLAHLVARWQALAGGTDRAAAEAALRRAAEFAAQDIHSIQYWRYRSGPLEEALAEATEYGELMRQGQAALAANDPVLAVACLSAAIKASSAADAKIKVSPDEWLERQRDLSVALVGLAEAAEAGKLRWLPPDHHHENKVEILLQLAAGYAREAQDRDRSGRPPEVKYGVAVKAWDALFRLYRTKLGRLVADEPPHRVISYCDEVMLQNVGSYISFRGIYFNPASVLDGLPPELREELQAETVEPDMQVAKLVEWIRLQRYAPPFPGREAFVDADLQANFQMGMALLWEGKWTGAFAHLRPILREHANSAIAAEIKTTLARTIDRAREAKDFNAIYNLASFLIGEMKGEPLPAEVTDRLVQCLAAAIEFYQDQSPMRKVFMLSLMADVLGDCDQGRDAHAEATRLGFAAVKAIALRTPEKPSLTLPSLIQDCSVDAFENATPYHLMVFYDGPERFFVRLNPLSKGSLALRNGDYETAVIVTSDETLPYRAKYQFAQEFLLHSYFIAIEGQAREQAPLSGDYFLLRLPLGLKAKVDPESGMIVP